MLDTITAHAQRLHQSIIADEIAYFFCLIITAWFVIALLIVLIGSKSPRIQSLIAITPSGLATLGILGTFIGILIGLLDFDVVQVDDSLPKLLQGLKTAFTTSIVGMAAAIVFRIAQSILSRTSQTDGVSPQQIHEVLEQIRDSLASKNDDNIITQIQKLRMTVQDGQKDLLEEFRHFADKMTENNQDALIKALENVIQDFNQNLTEQFGENFKQLNSAVEKLLEWQENYRQYITTVEQQIQQATAAIGSTEATIRNIQEHTQNIPEMLQPLSSVLATLMEQTQTLHNHLDAVAGIREQALQAFPTIENNLEQLTTGFSKHADSLVQLSAQTRKQEKETHQAFTEAWQSSMQKIDDQFNRFDQEMQKEMTRSLELLGRNLAAVSEKFIDDYTPLTQELQKLINIAPPNNSGR